MECDGLIRTKTNDVNENATQKMYSGDLFICEICGAYCGGQRPIAVSRHTWRPGWDPDLLLKRCSPYAQGFDSNDNAILFWCRSVDFFPQQLEHQYTIFHFLDNQITKKPCLAEVASFLY